MNSIKFLAVLLFVSNSLFANQKASNGDLTLSVQNGQGSVVNLPSVLQPTPAYSYTGGSYPGMGGTCGSALEGSSSCTIVLRPVQTDQGATDNIE